MKRNKNTAVIIAALFGSFGVHEMYVGRVVPALLMVVFAWTLIPMFIGWTQAWNWHRMEDAEWRIKVLGEKVTDDRHCKHCGHPVEEYARWAA